MMNRGDLRIVSMVRVLLFVCCLIQTLWCLNLSGGGALSHEAYVWQRHWSPRLVSAIEAQAEQVSGLSVLVAELSPDVQGGSVVRVPVDFEVLRETRTPVTLAIRVGHYAGPFDREQPMTQRLLDEVQVALHTAAAGGVVPAAVEIDFDCATSRLEGYAQWLLALRSVLNEVPLSITTLPTWMQRPEAFAALVRQTDQYVLQVHSVKRPDTIESEVQLCDPVDAERWVLAADRFGVPFHVALPTYGYRVAFDGVGVLAAVYGEDASPIDNPDLRYRVIRAEPLALARWVQRLPELKLQHCEGVIWYRLPIGNERLNWDQRTWHAVMAGRVDSGDWQVHAVPQADGLIELQIEQTAAIATPPPQQVRVEWGDAAALAWDGQRNYSVRTTPDHGLIWEWPATMTAPLLPQGTRWTIGWLRMDQATEFAVTVLSNSDLL